MELEIVDIKGKNTGRKQLLDDQVFAITPHSHSIYLEIKRYLAAQRQGTSKAKERAELSGSTRKLHKQKGTGGSRKGDIKNPLFKGGARVFGPKPRDYFQKQNRKLKRLAICSILSDKYRKKEAIAMENVSFEKPKTKDFMEITSNLGIDGKKNIFILPEKNNELYLSSRNLKNSKVKLANELSAYDLLNSSFLVFLEGSVEKLEEILKN